MKRPIAYDEIFDPQTYTIAISWRMFAATVLPLGCSKVQTDETKKAFYAGFLECFKVMVDYSSALEEDEASHLFTRLTEEGNDFFQEMVKQHNNGNG